MLAELRRHRPQPGEVERAVARDPEHLLVERGAQAVGVGLQLAFAELQRDRFVEQGVELAVQALEQLRARGEERDQRLAHRRVGLARGRLGEQAVGKGGGAGELFALLVDLELVEADVGDLFGQVAVDRRLRQRALLLEQDARQQQAALQHVDLLVDDAVAAVERVELLADGEVALGELVELVGGAQQVFGELLVGGGLARQQAAGGACGAGVSGQGLDGLRGLGAAALVDGGLQGLHLGFEAGDFERGEILARLAEVEQRAVGGQFRAAQGHLGVERVPFRGQRIAAFGAQRAAVASGLAAAAERDLDRRHARLAGADLALRALGAGAGVDEQGVGLVQAAAPVGEGGVAFREAAFELRVRGGGVDHRHRVGLRLQCGEQLACGAGVLRGGGDAGLQGLALCAQVCGGRQAGEGLLERLLGGALVGFGQLALGQRSEPAAQFVGDGCGGRLRGGVQRQQGQQQQDDEAEQMHGTEGSGGRRATTGNGCCG